MVTAKQVQRMTFAGLADVFRRVGLSSREALREAWVQVLAPLRGWLAPRWNSGWTAGVREIYGPVGGVPIAGNLCGVENRGGD